MLAREKWQINTVAVLEEVFQERNRQVAQYGHNETLEDGTGPHAYWLRNTSTALHRLNNTEIEKVFRAEYDEQDQITWMHLIREEVAEAFAESDPDKLSAELVQVAALCVSWVEKIRKR